MLHSFLVGLTPEGRRQPLFVGTVGEARSAADAAKVAGGVVADVQYAKIFVIEGAHAAHVDEFHTPPAAPPPTRTSAVATPPGPVDSSETREAYAGRLALMERPQLVLEAHTLQLTIRVATSTADLRRQLADTKFPPASGEEDESGV